MKSHIFLFTLGPVQGFIAQARKAHDLHSGSKLLSDLCRVAANNFLSEHGGEIIFPDISSDSIPNRFLGKITCDEAQLFQIGKAIENAVRDNWKMQFDESLADLLDAQVYPEAERQIVQHLDIQWLFQSLSDESDETYRQAYDELNKNLNALKNTRPFSTPTETGRKCSLDGERNVIFYRLSKDQNIRLRDKAPLYSTANLILDHDDLSKLKLRHLQPGEGLSAVSMLKRCHGFGFGDFPSTAEFALADMMKAVCSDPDGERVFQEMVRHFGGKKEELNWQVFYEENLNETYFKKQGLKESVEVAKEIQAKIVDVARKLETSRKLEKYYALIVFDGDHMGEWWKGVRLKSGVDLEVFHRELTSKLAEFAQKVRDEYPKGGSSGWVIYAGGDDFLGFFNLHHLTKAIDFLYSTYQQVVHRPLASRIKEGQDYALTFSSGVCIAHYKEPLSLVLSQARELEHKAKKYDEIKKNAIGIGVIPGSGQIAELVLPFEYFGNLRAVIDNLQTQDFSNAFVSKARTELGTLASRDGKLLDGLLPTAYSLIDRLVSRACNLTKKEGETEDAFKKRQREKIEPLQAMVKDLLVANVKTLGAFFDALDIADFIERQTHISTPKPEPADV